MNHADLAALLTEARHTVEDDRAIWCVPSATFETRLDARRGLILGGAHGPHYLRDAGPPEYAVPWQIWPVRARVIYCSGAADEPYTVWLPLMEAIASAGESLIVVTTSIGRELLQTFLVNYLRSTLCACVIGPGKDRFGRPLAGAEGLGRPHSTPPRDPSQLPLVAEAWIRRTASVLLPAAGELWPPAAFRQDLTVIETGGDHAENQRERLRYLMTELQRK
jgi:hypothetical protein